MEKRRRKKYLFILKNVDIVKIDHTYGITLESNLDRSNLSHPLHSTNIKELTERSATEIFSFLDESKKTHKCVITMIDHIKGENLANRGENCFWCRNPFSTFSLGCPIKYIPNRLTKTYYSEITKDKYNISSSIGKNTVLEDKKSEIEFNDYYQTDGIFCSFPCVMAFINDNRNNSIYNNSKTLLMRMYAAMYGNNIKKIIPASNWRLLKQYGGHLTISQFREGFNKVEYLPVGNYIKDFPKKTPKMKPIGFLYEENVQF